MWNDISTLLSNISQDLLWNLVTPAEYNSAITYQHFLHFPRIEKVVDIVHRKYTWLKNQIFDFQVILGERINFVCIRMLMLSLFSFMDQPLPSIFMFLSVWLVSFRDCHLVLNYYIYLKNNNFFAFLPFEKQSCLQIMSTLRIEGSKLSNSLIFLFCLWCSLIFSVIKILTRSIQIH